MAVSIRTLLLAGSRHAALLGLIWRLPLAVYYATLAGLAVAFLATRQIGVTWLPVSPDPALAANWPRMQFRPSHLLAVLTVCTGTALLIVRDAPLTLVFSRALRWYFSLPVLRDIGRVSIRMFTLHVFMMAFYAFVAPSISLTSQGALAVALILAFVFAPQIWWLFPLARSTRELAS